ncbi:MAG: hypothetical protein DI533_11395 [Cereibacter sphaeroides]|uniref:OmpA-like domain-containing protein n=1 Tax=Cereibacter sphaeroides TaxID=1063 RepID=A0A2W5S3Y7_CERSP|nr:MAG: hypothetical protein DI533_11395 [Cereibacter sphaeroides]
MRCAAIFAALVVWPLISVAQDVTLTSRDGTLAISGQFQGYDGELYRVMTEYGLLTVDGEGVTCEGPACPDLTNFVADIRIAGEPGLAASLTSPLVTAFAANRGFVAVPVEGGIDLQEPAMGRVVAHFRLVTATDTEAADKLRLGAADLTLSALAEPDLGARVLGMQALVAVTGADNPLPAMATADLARALSGQIQNWSELGGPDRPLVIHALASDSGFRKALEARLGQSIVAGAEHANLAELDAAVARDPWGLAVTAASANGKARRLTLTDSCGFALQPTKLAVKSEDYPLTQPFFVLTPKRRLPLMAREFLDFIETPAAGAAIASAGLIDRDVERTDLVSDGIRLANAIRGAGPEIGVPELQRLTSAMAGAQRLSLTFRFDGGARTLDAASRDNLATLVRLIEIGTFADQELVFAGFSDGSGPAAANLQLSRERADVLFEAVATAVPDLGDLRVSLAVEAFGEALPMACDESPIGRGLNRRVELWLRAPSPREIPETEN